MQWCEDFLSLHVNFACFVFTIICIK
jgi:hypothetical protein